MKNLLIKFVFSFSIAAGLIAQDSDPNIPEKSSMTFAKASRSNDFASFKYQFYPTTVANLH